MKIIGICGKAGAGKDTLGKILGGKVLSFASPLKNVCSYILDIPVEDFETQEGKLKINSNGYGLTNRRILQIVGTDMFRQLLDDDVWVDKFKRTAREYEYVVVTDLRFDNEAEAIIELGGFVLEIVRPEDQNTTVLDTSHASEQGISRHLITATIENDGSVDDLARKIDNFQLTL